jgi:biopolymer transport protein TolQ
LSRGKPEGPIGELYAAGVDKLNEFYEQSSNGRDPWHREYCKLSEAQLSAIEAVLEREVSHQIEQLETRIGMLGTMVSLSPFLGLFGTVWGVMMAFCGIAVAGKPDFFALAPGVAGALLTTVAGLVVAIPSLGGYNMLNGSIRHLTNMMDNFTEEFMVRLKLEQLELEENSRNTRDGE